MRFIMCAETGRLLMHFLTSVYPQKSIWKNLSNQSSHLYHNSILGCTPPGKRCILWSFFKLFMLFHHQYEQRFCCAAALWADTRRNTLQARIVRPSLVAFRLMPTSLGARLKPPLISSPLTASAIFSVVCSHGGCCVWYGASAAFLYLQLGAAGLPQFASAACHRLCFTVLILNEKHNMT